MRLMFTKLLPRSLSGRMTLILVLGLLAAQFASLLLHLQERAAMLAGGHVHPGMPALDALPLRFIWHVSLTLTAVIVVSLIAVRWATKPLQQMASAATAFAHDLDAPPLEVGGPTEVRRAAEAFNFMQHRLRQLVVERGRALAAVSHDLRTPLTRMRLRAELVDDPALQVKLNRDRKEPHGPSLSHHRTYGSRLRRFAVLNTGCSCAGLGQTGQPQISEALHAFQPAEEVCGWWMDIQWICRLVLLR